MNLKYAATTKQQLGDIYIYSTRRHRARVRISWRMTNNNNIDSSNSSVANILAQVIPAIMEVNKAERQAERTAADQRTATDRQELLNMLRFNELRADSKGKHYVKDLSLSDKELVWDHKKEHFVTWGKRVLNVPRGKTKTIATYPQLRQ